MEDPQQIGKYAVIGVAGKGNMGVVYVGHDPFSDSTVAIKLCPITEGSSFRLARKLFFNEAHTAGGLDHPNILSILDAGEQDGKPYIVMEYVEGADTLRSYITPGSLVPLPHMVELLYQCAKALDYAHRRGVVHRDIKPSNIMLTRDGTVKIGDFGIAQHALSDDTQVMGMLGSPRYMSPEQVNEEELTHQTDLYSLGVVGYELITGRPPFLAKGITQLVRKITSEEPPPVTALREGVPAKLGSIIARAMAKDPAKRYEYGHQMAADLASLFGDLSTPPPVPSRHDPFEQARKLRFFNEFSDAELREVLGASTWLEGRSGDVLVAERSTEHAFYVLASGTASVHVAGCEIGRLNEGECFGEMAFLTREQREASVVANEECSVIRVDGRLLESAGLPCQLRFNQVFLSMLVQRLSRTNARLAETLRKTSSP